MQIIEKQKCLPATDERCLHSIGLSGAVNDRKSLTIFRKGL